MLNVSLRQLRYLAALAETQSFSRAAQRMNVAQSTLSAAIQGIETALGAALVDRSGRSVRLTAAGELVIEHVRGILADIDQLPSHVAVASRPLTTRLRLGVIPSVAPFILPKVLPSLRAAYPKLRLRVQEGLTRSLLDDVRSGQLDAALIALPYGFDGFDHVALARDPFMLAVPEGHALARRRAASVGELGSETLLLLERGHCLRDHVLRVVNADVGDGDVRATSLITLVQLVENKMGVTLLPRVAIEAGLVRGARIRLVPLREGEAASRTLALVWRARAARQGDYRELAEHLRRHCLPGSQDGQPQTREPSRR
ncbi:hydrogen peroxide-inducible genes activator [Rhodoligotrophos defluvii]|uniref:hydrogen peroxide-inducible genes activator n=1 Tax=Rhodoligotrophos defluvii TaxID=2561934 RepID=UPI0010C9E494|nr:hydrogen peroxide-inducible genes activator [Rhodoligotrophos defluvii]